MTGSAPLCFPFWELPCPQGTWTERWAGEGQGRVGGCRGPGCCDCSSVLESSFAHRYKLHPQYQLNKGVAVAFTCHLSWSVSQLAHKAGKKEECYLLGPLKDPNRSRKPRENLDNSPSVCSDCMSSILPKERGLKKSLLVISWCIYFLLVTYKTAVQVFVICVLMYDTSMIYDTYMMLLSFPRV